MSRTSPSRPGTAPAPARRRLVPPPRALAPSGRRRLSRLAAGSAVALALLWALTAFLRPLWHPVNALDAVWLATMDATRSEPAVQFSRFLSLLGAGLPNLAVSVFVVVAALLWRGWRPAVAIGAAAVLSGADVRALKLVAERMRPPHHLVGVSGYAFPSGHVANTAVLAFGVALLAARAWVWVLGSASVALMALSRTMLSVHWLTDCLGGVAAGAAVVVGLWALAALLPPLRSGRPSSIA